MSIDFIKTLNPWWNNPEAIKEDIYLSRIYGKPYYFDNPIKRDMALEAGLSYILRGCRQIGKTTLLKEKILEAITSKKIASGNCLFLSCETFEHFEKLREILAEWLSSRKTERLLLCLDEITFVPEWQRAILWLFNAGLLKNSTTIITGSNARDLKKMGERFPGRHVKEINTYPLSIGDYKSLKCFESCSDLLKIYTQVGGFPHAIGDFSEYGYVTDETYETYSNWIFGDAHRFKLSRETLIHILFRIFDTIASQVTWQRLIETSPIKRHETAFAYVEHLDLAFLCKILDCYEPQKDMAAPRKAKKIYFIDPLIYVVAGGYLRGIRNCYKWWLNSLADNNFMGKIFESIVVNHYARRFDSIYYWYSSNLKREIDMLIRKENEILLYDIKLQSQEIKPALGKRVEVISPSDFNP